MFGCLQFLNPYKMKMQSIILMMGLAAMVFFNSCKKESTNLKLTFTNNMTEGIANASGEYTITGHISSAIRIDKVVLTKEGQATAFLTDDSTVKNKTEYDFSYPVTGITANTYILIDVFDQNGGKITMRFLIRK
jgi:hypothetical protein